jgi:hypothetical protein
MAFAAAGTTYQPEILQLRPTPRVEITTRAHEGRYRSGSRRCGVGVGQGRGSETVILEVAGGASGVEVTMTWIPYYGYAARSGFTLLHTLFVRERL